MSASDRVVVSPAFLAVWSSRRLLGEAGPTAYARGVSYERDRRVELVDVNANRVGALVRGTIPYRVTLGLSGRDGSWSCTCPVGEDGAMCKHVIAVALTPMATGFTGPIPRGQLDFEREVKAFGDQFSGPDSADAGLGDQAAHLASSWQLTDADRVLAVGTPSHDDLVRELLAPLSANASTVWVRNLDPGQFVQHLRDEQITATTASPETAPTEDFDQPSIRYLA